MAQKKEVQEEPKDVLANHMGKDLAGYQLAEGYYLELDHDLMGFFPVVQVVPHDPRGEIVVVLDPLLFKKVWGVIDHRRCKVGKTLVLAKPDEHKCFDMKSGEGKPDREKKPFHLYDEAEIDAIIKTHKASKPAFRWGGGFVSVGAGPEPNWEAARAA